MGRALGRRFLRTLLVLVGVSLLVFLILHLTPGDPARLMLPDGASDAQVQELRQTLGLNRPLPVQYVSYAGALLRGDLGNSLRFKQPNSQIIGAYLPKTLLLSTAALILAVGVGLPLGIAAALSRNSVWNLLSLLLALLGQSLSPIVLGPLLIYLLSVRVRLFPAFGADHWSSLVLPAVTLGAPLIALITRLTRSSVAEVLQEDFVRTAWAKGLPDRVVVFKHVLRNAIFPVVTVVGLQLGTLLGGAVVTETIFSFQGVGSLAMASILARDFPLVQSITLVVSLLFVLVNLLVDLSYAWINPRVRYE